MEFVKEILEEALEKFLEELEKDFWKKVGDLPWGFSREIIVRTLEATSRKFSKYFLKNTSEEQLENL